ncbi:MAG: nicotinate phosphoribosyltransferase [Bradymonadaceae bacterium]|nr:nicotinate phosphoribosyltransferase [Lujinxingiaceae bacterium]
MASTSASLIEHVSLYTDLYELTMAQGYFLAGKASQQACFDYFFRSNPFEGGYVVFAGMRDFLELLETLRFGAIERDYLRSLGFDERFLAYLADFRFRGEIWAPAEGEVVFPYAPVIRVRGGLLETQIVETLLLNVVNFSSLIATKASRIRRVAGERMLIEFGLRRAQGLGGLHASRAATIGGFDATSNVLAGYHFDLEVAGTQAHSWIQSFDDELTAFRAYAEHYPDKCLLLVDTYDTLRSGVPHAITVAKELEAKNKRLLGIRLDSGDLAYLAKKARQMLDEAGLDYVKIAASNQLDEHVIKSLLVDQGAPIDIFGVGTQLVTAYDDAALGGVYKLSEVDSSPRIKISENYQKVNFPAIKQVLRLIDDDGLFYADAVVEHEQTSVGRMLHPFDPRKSVDVSRFATEALLSPWVQDGEQVRELVSAHQSRAFSASRLALLPDEHKRFENPHIYKVGLSEELYTLREQVLERARQEIKS